MRNDRIMAVMSIAAIVCGLLVAGSLADTPYPEEAAGSACYFGEDANCHSSGDRYCTLQGVEECVYCTADSEIDDHFCGASTGNEECQTSGTHADCGESRFGVCTVLEGPVFKCVDTRKVISTTGCGEMDVECTGTNQL